MGVCLYYMIVLLLILPSICLENTTDMNDIRDDNHKIIKYIAILLFTLLLLYGIISNILLAAVFFRKDNHYSREFIAIASQLIISNFMAFIPQIVVVLPEILKTKKTTWINRTFSTFATFPFFSILNFSFLLTMNRFVALILPKYYSIFRSAKLYILIFLVWLSTFVFTCADFYFCTTEFLAWKLSWEGDCEKSNGIAKTWWRIRFFWALFIPNAMFVIYLTIFYSIRSRRQRITILCNGHGTMKNHHYEWSVLFQAAWNCGILETGNIVFNFLPPVLIKIFGEAARIPSKIFINCCFLFIYAILPTVHFVYNTEARDITKHHLYHLLHLRIDALKRTKPLFKVLGNIPKCDG
ncbi:putative integral membrane protein [Brugia pahangi]